MASINDKLMKAGLPGTLTGITAQKNIADPTITLINAANWETDTAVTFGMRQVYTTGVNVGQLVPNTYTEWKGVVTGTTVGNLTLQAGTDQVYPNTIATQVYMVVGSTWANSLVDALLISHKQDGMLKDGAVTVSSITDGTITRPKLATTTRIAPLIQYGRSVPGALPAFPNSADNGLQYFLVVPDDYVSGDLTVKLFLRATAGGGNLSLYRQAYRLRPGSPLLIIDAAPVFTVLPPTGNIDVWSFTVSSANFTSGDVIRIFANRDGPGVLDTSTADVSCDGAFVEYLGRA